MEIIQRLTSRAANASAVPGRYNQQTIFDEEPAALALRWYSQGAQWLHIVDLDGADAGEAKKHGSGGRDSEGERFVGRVRRWHQTGKCCEDLLCKG